MECAVPACLASCCDERPFKTCQYNAVFFGLCLVFTCLVEHDCNVSQPHHPAILTEMHGCDLRQTMWLLEWELDSFVNVRVAGSGFHMSLFCFPVKLQHAFRGFKNSWYRQIYLLYLFYRHRVCWSNLSQSCLFSHHGCMRRSLLHPRLHFWGLCGQQF